MNEKEIQDDIRVAISEIGVCSWRNNIGVAHYPNGSVVRYGVGGGGGSDIIGITPVVVTSDMVGSTLGIFTAIEVKQKNGKPTREQLNFIRVVREKGGIGGLAKSPEEALQIVNRGKAARKEHIGN